MIEVFFERIRKNFPHATAHLKGYSELEINKIEKLYGVAVMGDFRSFLHSVGRSDGGVIGDDPLIIYRASWNVRAHLLFQMSFFNSMQEARAWDFLNKPFVLALESETQYFFLQTGIVGEQSIFHFDENTGLVKNTGFQLADYLMNIMARYPLGGQPCVGELIEI